MLALDNMGFSRYGINILETPTHLLITRTTWGDHGELGKNTMDTALGFYKMLDVPVTVHKATGELHGQERFDFVTAVLAPKINKHRLCSEGGATELARAIDKCLVLYDDTSDWRQQRPIFPGTANEDEEKPELRYDAVKLYVQPAGCHKFYRHRDLKSECPKTAEGDAARVVMGSVVVLYHADTTKCLAITDEAFLEPGVADAFLADHPQFELVGRHTCTAAFVSKAVERMHTKRYETLQLAIEGFEACKTLYSDPLAEEKENIKAMIVGYVDRAYVPDATQELPAHHVYHTLKHFPKVDKTKVVGKKFKWESFEESIDEALANVDIPTVKHDGMKYFKGIRESSLDERLELLIESRRRETDRIYDMWLNKE